MRFVLPSTFARSRLYRPRTEPVPLCESAAADVAEVQVRADDGVVLHGWHCACRSGRAGHRPLILYFPGASGHRGYRQLEIELFAELGCDLLLVDYRGYGDNEGLPSERWFARDARRVWQYALNELDVPTRRIFLFGESLGGAVGTRLAAELCLKDIIPAGLILRATFTSMLDVVSQFFPWILASIFLVDRYPTFRRIGHVRCPLLSIHGTEDRLIPIEMGRRVFAAAPQTCVGGIRKRFLEIPGVGHDDIFEECRDEVAATLATFLQDAVPRASDRMVSHPQRSAVMQPLQ